MSQIVGVNNDECRQELMEWVYRWARLPRDSYWTRVDISAEGSNFTAVTVTMKPTLADDKPDVCRWGRRDDGTLWTGCGMSVGETLSRSYSLHSYCPVCGRRLADAPEDTQ